MAEGQFYPGVGTDDSLYIPGSPGYFYPSETTIALGDVNSGSVVRFPNVTIPAGSTILSAHVTFVLTDPMFANEHTANCYFNNVDNAVAPTTLAEAEALVKTDPVLWNVPAGGIGDPIDTADLKYILQTIIDRPGWASGNAIQYIHITTYANTAAGLYAIEAESGAHKAELHVTWGPTIHGDLDQNLPALTGSGSGEDTGIAEEEIGALNQILPALSISASGLIGQIGGLIQNLPGLTLAAYGGGIGNLILPPLSLLATGLTGISGRMSQSLPPLALSAHGLAAQAGSIILTLPHVSISATGFVQIVGIVEKVLPRLSLSATGLTGSVGRVHVNLPSFALVASGFHEVKMNGDMVLPALLITAHGEIIPATVTYKTVVLNPKNLAVSEYTGWKFNSFAFFNGKYLAAGSSGIHVLEGDTDNGDPIMSLIKTGHIPTGSGRARDIYLMGRSSGQMRVALIGDEKEESREEADYLLSQLGQDRIVTPRGMDPVYLQIAISNSQGGDFDFDSIQVFGEALKRRKK